jgi:hypothetical protein
MEATAIGPVRSLAWMLVAVRMIHLLVVISLSLSLPPQLYRSGLDEGVGVVVPLDGGHGDHPGQVLGAVADGGEEEPGYHFLLSWCIQPRG